MIGPASKFFRFTVTSLIVLLFLYLTLNIIVVAAAGTILKHFDTENLEIRIGTVNSILIPFYIDTSSVYLRYKDWEVSVDKLTTRLSYRNFYQGDPFITLKTSGGRIILPKVFSGSGEGHSSTSALDYFSTIKRVQLIDTTIIAETVGALGFVDLERFLYNGQTGDYQLEIAESSIRRGEAIEIFSGSSKGKLNGSRIEIDHLELLGNSIFVQSNDFLLSPGLVGGEFIANIGSDVLGIIYPGLSGAVNLRCNLKNKDVVLAFETDGMVLDGNPINLNGRASGQLPGQMQFQVETLELLNYAFQIDGKYNSESTYLDADIQFLKPVTIYKGHGWNVFVKDALVQGRVNENLLHVKTKVTSEETYQASFDARFNAEKMIVQLDKMVGISGTSKFTGHAVSDFKSIKIFGSGHVKNNKEVVKILKLQHEGDVDLEFEVDQKYLRLKGDYRSNTPQQLYGVGVKTVEGNFDLSYGGIVFTANSTLDNGHLDINGRLNFRRQLSRFDFMGENVYFSSILDYFKVPSDIDIPVTGKAVVLRDKAVVTAYGNFSADQPWFDQNSVDFEFADRRLDITKADLDGNVIDYPLYFDFTDMSIHGLVERPAFQYRNYPDFSNIKFTISGKIVDPQFDATFGIDHPLLKASVIQMDGTLQYFDFVLDEENLSADIRVKSESKSASGSVTLKDYLINEDKGTVTGHFQVDSDDFKTYRITNEELVFQSGQFDLYVENLSFNTDLKKVNDLNAILKGPYWDTVHVENMILDQTSAFGTLRFNHTKLSYGPASLSLNGTLHMKSNYTEMPQLFGDLEMSGDIEVETLRLRLPVDEGNIRFFGETVSARASGKELDMSYETVYTADRYADYLSSDFSFIGQNVYFSTSGLSSVVDVNAAYNRYGRVLDLFVFLDEAKLHTLLKQRKVNTVAPELPIDINATIKTHRPVYIENEMFKSDLSVDMNVLYREKELILGGKLYSSKGSLNIAGNQFLLDEGFVNFTEDAPPYVYMEANGTGVQRSVSVKVSGFLPNYNIELTDKDPNHGNYMEADADILKGFAGTDNAKTKHIATEILNGAIIDRVVSVSEKLFGINRIGFEQSRYRGGSSHYLKVGKRFSDRLELKYVVGTGRDDKNAIVGEYLIMDWFKVIVYSTTDGGNGAGFTFFTHY